MLDNTVGKNGKNNIDDVKTIQQIINLRDDLRKSTPNLIVDGHIGQKTQSIIDQIESTIISNPSGLISPYDAVITKMWPTTYGKPTGLGIRGTDAYGGGFFGATRGHRIHDGTDYISTPGNNVYAPLSGRVRRISKPYSSGIDAMALSGLEIEASDGTKCWAWYMQPSSNIIGRVVKAGTTIIGKATTLKNRYKNGMTDHIHIRIHTRQGVKINPATVIK